MGNLLSMSRPWADSPYGLVSVLDMLRFYADRFHSAIHMMSTFRVVVKEIPNGRTIKPELRKKFLNQLEPLSAILGELNLLVSKKNVDYLIERIKEGGAIDQQFRFLLDCNFRVMNDELGLAMLFSVKPENAKYYEPPEPLFGKTVADQFPSDASAEIDEAGKCFALSRHTACVFHLMRILEVGIGAIRYSLGMPDPVKDADRNWGKMLKTIKAEIDRRNAAKPAAWKNAADKDFFEGAIASLDAVKNVWRNATMHVEKTYGEEQAEHIFNAVRGFMSKLAERIDEKGQPLA
jgi:hypothetical protein